MPHNGNIFVFFYSLKISWQLKQPRSEPEDIRMRKFFDGHVAEDLDGKAKPERHFLSCPQLPVRFHERAIFGDQAGKFQGFYFSSGSFKGFYLQGKVRILLAPVSSRLESTGPMCGTRCWFLQPKHRTLFGPFSYQK